MTGIWSKYVRETTKILYKSVLKERYMDTGGGSGVVTLFEGWSDAKLGKFNIDVEIYDHTNVGNMPTILIIKYYK